MRTECMIRRLKKNVLPELPGKTRRMVPLKLARRDFLEYNKAEVDFLSWLQAISPARAKKAAKSEALTKVGYLLRLAARLKLPLLLQWIKDFYEAHPGDKLVAFSMNTFVLDYLQEKFNRRCVVVNGKVRGRLRHEAVRKFQSNPKVDLFLGNWRAAGVGLTLTASHNVVALDYPWTPGDLMQGEDRVNRIGQKKDCTIHYLMALHTIEEKLVAGLRKKADILAAVLDGKHSSMDFDVFNELLEDMAAKRRL